MFLCSAADTFSSETLLVFFSSEMLSGMDLVLFPRLSDIVTSSTRSDDVTEMMRELLSGEMEASERELWGRERRGDSLLEGEWWLCLSERLGECCRSLVEMVFFCFSITSVTV